jgi:hypothetical protein
MAFFLLYSVFYYLLAIPSITGLLVLLRRASLPALYCLFYGITLSIWPIRLEWRHILPVIVFAYYFYFVGFRFYASRIKKLARSNNRSRYSKFCGVAAIVFGCYLVVGAGVLSCWKAGWNKALSAPPMPSTTSEFQEAVAWVRANTAPDAVFVCNNDPVFYLYTKRHAIMPTRMELWRFANDKYVDADSLRQAIRFSKATYVMNEPAFRTSGFTYAQLHDTVAELQRLNPDALVPIYRSTNGLVEIYRVGKF